MNNKEFIENYIKTKVPESARPGWVWMLDSDLAREDEQGLTYAPGTIQEAMLRAGKGTARNRTMNSIVKRYNQLVDLYTYANECNYIKYNPFKSDKFIDLQIVVDIYFSNQVNVNYVSKEQLNELLIALALRKKPLDKKTRLQIVLYLVSLYNGIDADALKDLKFSEIDEEKQTISGKPIGKNFLDMIAYYKNAMGENIYEDHIIIPSYKCDDLQEYKKAQDRIGYNIRFLFNTLGKSLNYYKMSKNDVINSGFVQYLKSRMSIESISELYYVKPKDGVARSLNAKMFNDIAIDFYYKYYKTYKLDDVPYNFSRRQTVIGKTISYLYQDEDYKNYRAHQIMTE